MLKQRILTALLLGAGVLLTIFALPGWAFGLAIALVMALALWEWCSLVKIGLLGFVVLTAVCAGPVAYCGFVPVLPQNDSLFLLGVGYVLSISFWLLSVPTFLYFKMEPVGWYWRYGVAAMMMIPTGVAMLELQRASPSLMLAALLVVCVADIAAFFVGRRFGKHKLAPEISPGKTWEGVVGAAAGVMLYCIVLWMCVPAVQTALSFVWVVFLALLFVLVCVLGDLFESLVKREAGVKDSGTLLPGHGGVLDRVDSMLAFFPFAGATLLLLQLMTRGV